MILGHKGDHSKLERGEELEMREIVEG